MCSQRLGPGEEFLVLFNELRQAAKYDPRKLRQFYRQSAAIRKATDELYTFMFQTKLETMVEQGKRFHVGLPKRFSSDYQDYKLNWKHTVEDAGFVGLFAPDGQGPIKQSERNPADLPETERPDFKFQENFDPRYHNAGSVIDIGLGYLAELADDETGDYRLRNLCRIAVEGGDYLHQVIGINLVNLADRYRRIPVTFVPAHVASTFHPRTKDLLTLLDDAVLAYVAGASNASIAMCRAVLEKLLKVHYRKDELADENLENLIDFCARQFAWVAQRKKPLHGLRKLANRTLHSPRTGTALSAPDEETLLAAFANLKFLIEKAPVPGDGGSYSGYKR